MVSPTATIDRESPLPLYAQIQRRLRATILSWPPGDDRFHTEQGLCEQFGVSRATVRQAMAELEAEGLLQRRKGFGTLVNRQKIEESFSPMTNFSDQWARSGRSLKVEVQRVERIPCPARMAETLQLAEGAPVLYIERYRLSGALRVAWDQRFIPWAVAEGIPKREFSKVSLLDVLATKVNFDCGQSQLEAALAGEEYAERLDLLPNDPVLLRQLLYIDMKKQSVMAGLSVYRADQVRYTITAPMRGRGPNLDARVRVPLTVVGTSG